MKIINYMDMEGDVFSIPITQFPLSLQTLQETIGYCEYSVVIIDGNDVAPKKCRSLDELHKVLHKIKVSANVYQCLDEDEMDNLSLDFNQILLN